MILTCFGVSAERVIRRRSIGWWSKFNYITSAALDSGTIISVIVIFLSLQINGQGQLDWWGNRWFANSTFLAVWFSFCEFASANVLSSFGSDSRAETISSAGNTTRGVCTVSEGAVRALVGEIGSDIPDYDHQSRYCKRFDLFFLFVEWNVEQGLSKGRTMLARISRSSGSGVVEQTHSRI